MKTKMKLQWSAMLLILALVGTAFATPGGRGYVLTLLFSTGNGHAVTATSIPHGATSANPDGIYTLRENSGICAGAIIQLVIVQREEALCAVTKGDARCCDMYHGATVKKLYRVDPR